jgi:seryl-tRNA synthetase
MSSNKNDNEFIGLGLTPKALRQDLILFKEEVLEDIKTVQKEFTNKFGKMEETLKNQINIYESKVNNFEQRINNLSNLISSDKSLIQKVEELVKYKEDSNDKLITESIRLTNLETDFKTNIKNIENILSNSVIYPGIIGYSAKFKTFHDFIDYVLKHISDLDLFKEKSIHDLGPYKKKID